MIALRVPNASSLRLAVLVVLSSMLLARASSAQGDALDALDLQTRGELLGEWLDAQSAQQKKERRFTGGSVLTVGAAGLGYGMAILIGPANNEISKGGGIALTAAGAFGAALGVFRLVVESESEKVARRYRSAVGEGLERLDVARFEGEFYAAARHAHRVQQLARWLGFATTVAGVAVLIATPFAGLSSGGRVAGYVAGGLLVLGGGANFAGSFATPPPIKAWEGYQGGQAPSSRSGRLFGFAPVFGKRHVGVALVLNHL
jgi:hypothetical protein